MSIVVAAKRQSDLLNVDEAANFLGVSRNTLAMWRTTKRYDIPYIKVGRRVLYSVAELTNWLASRTVRPAGETAVIH